MYHGCIKNDTKDTFDTKDTLKGVRRVKRTELLKIREFRSHIEKTYRNSGYSDYASFDEILCYELHSQPVNPRMMVKTGNEGFQTGLTFKELAQKWGISTRFLGQAIADHCKRL